MRRKATIYHEMLLGNSYSNEEAIAMRDHFKMTADLCYDLGPRFILAALEADYQYTRLKDVCVARGI